MDGYMPTNFVNENSYFAGELLEQELNTNELYINTRVNNVGSFFQFQVQHITHSLDYSFTRANDH